MDKAEIVFGVILMPCVDTSEAVEPGKKAFDFPSTAIAT
jgi:hypothetical protein